MRKLKLNPEQLAVESFRTDASARLRATVRGADQDYDIGEPVPSDDQTIITGETCRTECFQKTCFSCNEPTCNSCVTACMTGNYPICCPP
jgi:hypothetical protein